MPVRGCAESNTEGSHAETTAGNGWVGDPHCAYTRTYLLTPPNPSRCPAGSRSIGGVRSAARRWQPGGALRDGGADARGGWVVRRHCVQRGSPAEGDRASHGARGGQVVAMVWNGAFRRVAAGLVLGVPLAAGGGRLLSAQLYGVRYWDPPALGVAVVSLAVCAFCASIIPALRAASTSPTNAFRAD